MLMIKTLGDYTNTKDKYMHLWLINYSAAAEAGHPSCSPQTLNGLKATFISLLGLMRVMDRKEHSITFLTLVFPTIPLAG
jgi:hypothetical protein